MDQRDQQSANDQYPHGRGYGHDYMRGGEVFGGYGYSERPEYERRRGELNGSFTPESGERRRASDAASTESTDR